MQPPLFADVLPVPPPPPAKVPPKRPRGAKGRFSTGPIPESAEIATMTKGEFLSPLDIDEFPNQSQIIRERSRGQGIRFYDTMLGTDPDLTGFYRDLADDVLHYPYTITPASDAPEHLEHARFLQFALRRIPNWQNVIRHAIDSYARGFSVFEKLYEVIESGEWAGAVTYSALLDKPQRWFAFDRDRRLRFKTEKNMFPGELVDQEKFVVVTFGSNSNPWGEATLDFCYWPWFLKHHAMKNQAIFMEKWASPTAKVEYEHSATAKTNEINRQKSLSVLLALQNDQAIAVPKGMLVSLIESARNGTVSFEGYIDQLTQMESRLVTGQLLTSMGSEGGSYALGKVHEKRAANKVEMIAGFTSETFLSRQLGRELIVRNYGRQDGYPEVKILALSPTSRQAEASLEQQLIANGHRLSRSHSEKVFGIVRPVDEKDVLAPEPGSDVKPGQLLPVNPQLAGLRTCVKVSLAEHQELLRSAKEKARAKRAHLDAIGRVAVGKARPAIKRIVKSLGAIVRAKGKKGLGRVTRTHVYGGLRGASGTAQLGDALHTMLDRPARLGFAESDEGPPDISTSAKLALALLMLAIAERIVHATEDAADSESDPGAFADSLSDPAGVGVDEAFGNLFEGTHSTNIASVATANLRARLESPKFRRENPYVMIVVTNPNARLGHRMMDGFVISAEEARYSPFLPPFDFGCDCQVVLISAAEAQARGLTGAAPAGSLDEFLQAKGASPAPRGGYRTPDGQVFTPGGPFDFQPAYAGTDARVQLDALRVKAEEIRGEDPEAWGQLTLWLVWLFSMDVLRLDPPIEGEEPPS